MSAVKPPKSREERKPERVLGNWREYRSSSGKAYYYNDVTKKNQWEKPPEWDDQLATPPNGRPARRPHRPSDHRQPANGPKKPDTLWPHQNDLTKFLKNINGKNIIVDSSAAKNSNGQKAHSDTTNTKPPATVIPQVASTVPINPKKKWREFVDGKRATPQKPTPEPPQNGPNTTSILDSRTALYKRKRSRIDEFKRAVPELPKLPDISDFEALRPCADANLISTEVRNLLQGMWCTQKLEIWIYKKISSEQNQRQISELLPKKCHLSIKLARTSTDLKHHRAEVGNV